MTGPDLAGGFDTAGVDGGFHAVDLTNGNEISHQSDCFAIPASVFKLPVPLELFRQHEAAELDATIPVSVAVTQRAPGPYGLSVMLDPVSMSLRDLAWQMMGISDNAATDVNCSYVGLDKVNETLISLGLRNTTLDGDCRDLFASILEDLGLDTLEEIEGAVTWEMFNTVSAFDPARAATRTTPRDMTTLLGLIWKDKAAPAGASSDVRRILGLQVWPHRLASGFNDLEDVKTSGKTGTLPSIRNEVGVVEYADGGRYAVACSTRALTLKDKNPKADAVIGGSARLAVDYLRSIA